MERSHLIGLFLGCLLTPSFGNLTLNSASPPVQPLHLKSGLLFSKHEDLVITSQSWSVVLHVDLNGFSDQLLRLQGVAFSLMLKNDVNHTDPVDALISKAQTAHYHAVVTKCDQDRQIMNEIQRSMTGGLNITKSTGPSRARRGFGSSVGSMLQFLFGLSTERQYRQVNDLVKDQKYKIKEIVHFNQAQASLVNHSYTQLRATENHLTALEDHVDKLNLQVKTAYAADKDHMNSRLLYMADSALHQTAVDLTYDLIHQSIMGLRRAYFAATIGVLDPFFLTTAHFLQIAKNAASKAPGMRLLAHDSTGTLKTYFNLVHLTAFEDNGNLKLFLEFPMYDQTTLFSLFEMVPFPSSIENSNLFFSVHPPQGLLAVNARNESYFFLDKSDLHFCKRQALLTCPPRFAIYRSSRTSCITSLFHNTPIDKRDASCPIQTFQTFEPQFYKADNMAGYFYSVQQPLALYTECTIPSDRGQVPFTISGSGILTVPSSCSVIAGNQILVGHGNLDLGITVAESHIRIPTVTPVRELREVSEANLTDVNSNLRPVLTDLFDEDTAVVDLSTLIQGLRQLTIDDDDPSAINTWIDFRPPHHWNVGPKIAVVLVVAVAMLYCYARYNKCLDCLWSVSSTPAPGRHARGSSRSFYHVATDEVELRSLVRPPPIGPPAGPLADPASAGPAVPSGSQPRDATLSHPGPSSTMPIASAIDVDALRAALADLPSRPATPALPFRVAPPLEHPTRTTL